MKVHIGSTKYELNTPKKIVVDEVLCRGALDESMSIIEVSKEFPLQSRKQTLWHEVVHGILFELGEHELTNDEGFVDSLSKQLYAFNENNKLDKIYEKLSD